MSAQDQQPLPPPVPLALQPQLALNTAFGVLLCTGSGCNRAIVPRGLGRHLYRQHQADIQVRRLADAYVELFLAQSSDYAPRTVPLPPDGSAPQSVLPVEDGFQCRDCSYKTRSRNVIRKHVNKEHSKKRLDDEKILTYGDVDLPIDQVPRLLLSEFT